MKKKSALDRKNQTEQFLKELGIPFITHLPAIEEEQETVIRTAQEIAKRILILTYLCYAGEDEEDKPQIVQFLKDENLWGSVSPGEKKLLLKDSEFTQQERINISWKSECIWLLLWLIDKFEILELPDQEAQIPEILEILPGFMASTNDFIESAELRDKSEILDQADLIYRLHWATRNDELNETISTNMNASVVVERHYAINWATNYLDQEWDDITTDT